MSVFLKRYVKIVTVLMSVLFTLPVYVTGEDMKEVVHNKLVRDKILDILSSENISFEARVLTEEEYRQALYEKLQEEVFEFLTAKEDDESLKELADIVEVIHALLKAKGVSFELLEEIRSAKLEERGGFFQRIFLEKESYVSLE